MEGIFAVAVFLIGCSFFLFARRKREVSSGGGDTFRDSPWLYDRKVVEVSGVVVKVFHNSLAEVIKRRCIDLFRTKTGSADYRHRYIHQRFLLRSDELNGRGILLVEHNVKHGKHPIKKGSLVTVKGEYLHTVSRDNKLSRSWLLFLRQGQRYGRIHKTYPPGGIIEVR